MKGKRSTLDCIADGLIFLVVTAFAFLCFYPFYYMIIYAFSDSYLAASGITWLPKGFTLNNFRQILAQPNIVQAFWVSISRTVLGTALATVCSALLGFIVSQPLLPARRVIYRFCVSSMYLSAGLIPWFVTMKMYGLQDNFLLYIVPGAVNVFHVILCKTYIEQVPYELTEAAMIDGAGPLRVFFQVVFPLCRPVLATVAIFTAVGQWNSWMDNFYLVNDASLQTLQLTLLNYLTQQELVSSMSITDRMQRMASYQASPTAIRMAISVFVAAPILLVYPIFQKQFVKGILIGAVKG